MDGFAGVLANGSAPNTVSAVVDRMVYAAPVLNVLVQIEDANEIQVTVPNEGGIKSYQRGDIIDFHLPPRRPTGPRPYLFLMPRPRM